MRKNLITKLTSIAAGLVFSVAGRARETLTPAEEAARDEAVEKEEGEIAVGHLRVDRNELYRQL